MRVDDSAVLHSTAAAGLAVKTAHLLAVGKASPVPRVPWNKGISWQKGQNNVAVKVAPTSAPKSKQEPLNFGLVKLENPAKNDTCAASKRQRSQLRSILDVAVPAKCTPAKTKSSIGKLTQSERHASQRQEMALIMKNITNHGFDLKHVEPDGSCLFRALSIQVQI